MGPQGKSFSLTKNIDLDFDAKGLETFRSYEALGPWMEKDFPKKGNYLVVVAPTETHGRTRRRKGALLRWPSSPIEGLNETKSRVKQIRIRLLPLSWYYMKAVFTIRLEPELQRELDELCGELGRTRSDVMRDALRRQLNLMRFERTRRRILPFAESQGYLTDEDVFRDVS